MIILKSKEGWTWPALDLTLVPGENRFQNLKPRQLEVLQHLIEARFVTLEEVPDPAAAEAGPPGSDSANAPPPGAADTAGDDDASDQPPPKPAKAKK